VGSGAIGGAGRLGPRADRETLDELSVVALMKSERFASECLAWIDRAQATSRPIRRVRYSSRCGTIFMLSASSGV